MTRYATCLFLISLLAPIANGAVDVTLLGPQQYLRGEGAPTLYSDEFPGVPGPALITVRNGSASGDDRIAGDDLISSAKIWINGTQVFGPSDFNQQVGYLEATVDIGEENLLEVELRSSPGSHLTIEVTQAVEAEAAAVIGPEGGAITVDNPTSPLFQLTIAFPEDAVQASRLVLITPVDSPHLVDGLSTGNVNFSIQPDISLNVPATLTTPYAPQDIDPTFSLGDDLQQLFLYSSQAESWIPVGDTAIDTIDHIATTTHLQQLGDFALWEPRLYGATPSSIVESSSPPVAVGCQPHPDGLQYPPVLLVHGYQPTGSGGRPGCRAGALDTFGDLPQLLLDEGVTVCFLSYSTAKSVHDAAWHDLAAAITKILDRSAYDEGTVTLIAHSLGGILGRYLLENPRTDPSGVSYRNRVNGLLTLATPHHGTRVAVLPLFWCHSLHDLEPCGDFLDPQNENAFSFNGSQLLGLNPWMRLLTEPLNLLGPDPDFYLFGGNDDGVVPEDSSLALTCSELQADPTHWGDANGTCLELSDDAPPAEDHTLCYEDRAPVFRANVTQRIFDGFDHFGRDGIANFQRTSRGQTTDLYAALWERVKTFVHRIPLGAANTIAHWNFDEGRGDVAHDVSGNDNDGMIVGADWTTGLSGSALAFNDFGDKVVVPHRPGQMPSDAITLEAIIRPTGYQLSATFVPIVVKNQPGASNTGYSMFILSDNRIDCRISSTTSPSTRFLVSRQLTQDEWHHIACIYDGTELRLYVDGEALPDARRPHTGQIVPSTWEIVIGGDTTYARGAFRGDVDAVRISGRALSPTQFLPFP